MAIEKKPNCAASSVVKIGCETYEAFIYSSGTTLLRYPQDPYEPVSEAWLQESDLRQFAAYLTEIADYVANQ